MDDALGALRASVERLGRVVERLDDRLEAQAYPSEWTVAQVISHLGSSAVIFGRRLDDIVAGQETPSAFNQEVWDEWNAKSPRAQAEDGLTADAALLESLESMSEASRAEFAMSMGPITFGFDVFVGMRLNEHTLHTWDVEVVDDPGATLPDLETAEVVGRLGLIARYSGKPSGGEREIVVRTTTPERMFRIEVSDSVQLEDHAGDGAADLTLPAEALIRLVYGRLDPEHTPEFEGDAALLDELRTVFPGA
jgi:uncharacterized protein (TIGR03083 family)